MKWNRFGSLQARLSGSFLLVVLVSIGVAVGLVNLAALPRLESAVSLINRSKAFRLSPFFADYYQRHHNSWDGAAGVVTTFAEPMPPALLADELPWFPNRDLFLESMRHDRLVLVDSAGVVVADSSRQLEAGQLLPLELSRHAVPVTVQGQTVGGLILPTAGNQTSMVALTAWQRSMLAAGMLAAVAAAFVGLWLAYRLARPLQTLSAAARQLARFESSRPLPVESNDELGQLTRTFNDMMDALTEQKRLRRQMVADIAHELRTPLSVMQLDIEGMADGLQSPAETTQSLKDELDTLNRLIEDLRQLSLADAGGLEFHMDELPAVEFLQRVAALWRPKMATRQIDFSIEISPHLPVILADEGRLAQVLHNLLGNALRYTPAGGTISLGSRTGHNELLIWVADSGPGIDIDDLPYVFDRFYRADKSRSRDTGGSGLGLAIAKQWTRLHGGRIWVESEPGQGARFYLALPVSDT
jgi:signal transduction histidine kinase